MVREYEVQVAVDREFGQEDIIFESDVQNSELIVWEKLLDRGKTLQEEKRIFLASAGFK